MISDRGVATLLTACRLMWVASAAELLTNGSFEDVKDGRLVGWNLPQYYSCDARGGMNGTHGVAFENGGDKEFYSYPSQNVPFEPGKRYEFSIWVKTENLTKNMGLCIEWFDVDGNRVCPNGITTCCSGIDIFNISPYLCTQKSKKQKRT